MTAVIPAMRYEDAPAAIRWLCSVFGFEEHFVVPGPDDTIAHAQLTFRSGMVMLGSAYRDEEYGPHIKTARATGHVTHVIYVVVEDIDAHYARSREGGAEISRPLADTEYGSREYEAIDLEGYRWSFGTYDPLAG